MAEGSSSLNDTRRLDRFLEIGRIFSSTVDLSHLLQAISTAAAELTSSEASWLALYDPVQKQLKLISFPPRLEARLQDRKLSLETSFAGWAFIHRRPLVIQDTSGDPRLDQQLERWMDLRIRSSVATPLTIRQSSIGVLEVINKKDNANYTQDDQELLETLAALAAMLIENDRLRDSLEEARSEVEKLDQLKSDFIAITSHELRTPLGLILGHATFLQEMIPEQFREQMEVIVNSCIRLKRITEDLSAIAHQEQGKSRVRRAPFSVRKLIEDVAARYAPAAGEKRILLAFDLPEKDPLVVDGEQQKIEIALGNILDNAIIFTDEEGQIGIKAEASAGQVQVFVADNGIGIPQEDLARVFERFYQVESHLTRKHGGMGLGLSIAKAMIEMHGGHIWCESKEGVGSIFGFSLPSKKRTPPLEAASA